MSERLGRIAGRAALLVVAMSGLALAVQTTVADAACSGGGPTIEQNHFGRVWKTRVNGRFMFYGCLWRAGVHVRLDTGIDERFLDIISITKRNVEIGSRYVGVGINEASSDGSVEEADAEVLVKSLRTGRTKRRLRLFGGTGNQHYATVEKIVMNENGSVAWINHTVSFDSLSGKEENYRTVARADLRGRSTLDSAAEIKAGSLTLQGSRLTWRHGTAVRRSTLR